MGGRGQIDAFGDFKYWGGISEECVLGVLWYLRKKSDSVEVVQRKPSWDEGRGLE